MRLFVYRLSFLFILIFVIGASAFAQNADLENKIKEYQQKLTEIRNQKNTLGTQIQEMDTKIYLTGLTIQQTEQKIIDTEAEIEKLTSRIGNLDTSLDTLSKLLLHRIVKGYKTKTVSLFQVLLNTDSVSELTNTIKYQQTTQASNQKLLVQVQEAKLSYEEQKTLRETKKTELDQLVVSLNNQKQELKNQQSLKQKLLAETNNDESTYQSLLAQAEAQLKGFGAFVQSQGGSGILSNQTVCDDWGCYYNQRDSQWGNNSLNGTQYSLASDGCLVTAMAMMYTHSGHRGITPQSINSNPFNFASYYPAYLNKGTINAGGVSSTRTTIAGYLTPDMVQSGPVVVGVRHGTFGTHFVVVKSYSDGKYIMNDPYIEGGKDKVFTDYYSLGSVFEVDRVTF